MESVRDIVDRVSKAALDRGALIEAGWLGYEAIAIPPQAGPQQRDDLRAAFFAGSQHLFGSVLSVLDPGSEPTDADLRRMDLVKSELDEFIRQFKRKHGIPE